MDDLGVVVMFTLPQQTTVPVGAITSWFADLGLNPAYLPGDQTTPAYAFRQACRDFRLRYTHPRLGAATVYAVEEGHSTQKVVFQLIRQTRPGRIRGDIIHDTVGQLILYKPARGREDARERIRTSVDNAVLLPSERALLEEETERFRGRYHLLRKRNHANRLRTMLRDYLTEELYGISLRAGGVYFVPTPFHDDAYSLEVVVRRIGQGATWDLLPVQDQQQAMVAHHLVAHLNETAERLIDSARARPMEERHESRYQALVRTCEVYAPLLDGLAEQQIGDTLRRTRETLSALEDRRRKE